MPSFESESALLTVAEPALAGFLPDPAGPSPSLAVGAKFGPYLIRGLIGIGGMGEVYMAEDSRLKRRVALKLLSRMVDCTLPLARRFTREALAVSALHHPNIPVVYEAGEIDGRHYIASEYVDGEPLQQRIARGRLAWREAVAIALDVAVALEAAHGIGVIHRDVKPSNILVCPNRRSKLVDFGIAKISDWSQRQIVEMSPPTAMGMVVGTPGYMAPEQAAGKTLDPRTDLWSLAAVLHEMVTGRRPDAAMGRQDLPGPKPLARLIARGLQADPERRFATASEFAAALRHMQGTRLAAGSPILLGLGALLGAALIAVVAWRLLASPASHAEARPAIAVLPFDTMSSDAGSDYLSQGIQEEVMAHIARISGLKVMSRHASAAFSSRPVSLQAVSAALHVGSVLEGSIQVRGDRVRVIVHLIDAHSGADLWSESYDRQTQNIFDVERDIAERVAAHLRTAMLTGERSAVATPDTHNPESHKFELLGRFYMARRDGESYEKAIEYFQDAVRLDPRYAMAYADLSLASYEFAGLTEEPQNLNLKAQARMAAQHAVAIAPDLAEGHVALGWVLLFYDWNVNDAQREFELAVQLAPNSARAKNGLATLDAKLGRFDAAIALMNEARALDPLSSGFANNLANFWLAKGDDAAAENLSREALELEPKASVSHRNLALIALRRGAVDEAQSHAEQEPNQGFKEFSLALVQQARGSQLLADESLHGFIERHQRDEPFYIAEIYALRGDADNAFAWLDRAFQAHDTSVMDILEVPLFARLRADPRYSAFCSRLGVPAPSQS